MMDKHFIIKADDLKYRGFSRQWKRFLSICNERNIPAALGLIGKTIDTPKEIAPWFISLIESHEIFAHGYYHLGNEYLNTDLNYQVNSISKTINLVRQKLNREVVSFGAPHNKYNYITEQALEQVAVSTWLFGMSWKGNNLSIRNFEFEYSKEKPVITNKYGKKLLSKIRSVIGFSNLYSCTFDELRMRYNSVAGQELIVGQIHPKLWYEKDIKELERFLDYVLLYGRHKFITPDRYFNKLQSQQSKIAS